MRSTKPGAPGGTFHAARSDPRRSAFLLVILAGLAPVARVDAQTTRLHDTIPFEIVMDKFVFTARVDGKPARFILDTGGQNVITADSAGHYGVQLLASQTVAGIGDATMQAGLGAVKNLQIGQWLNLETAKVTVTPPNGFFRALGVAGVVGGEAFATVCLSIDKRNRRFTISYPFRPNGVPRDAGTPMKMGDAFRAVVPVAVGDECIDVLFDTGMSGFLSLGTSDHEKLRARPGNIETRHAGYGILHVGITGFRGAASDSIYKACIPRLTLPGGKEFRDAGTLVGGHSFSVAGQELFDHGVVMLDYPRGLFYFFPHDAAPADVSAATRAWNVKILPVAGHFEVVATIGDAGLAVGDRVWCINDADLSTREPSEAVVDGLLGDNETATVTVGRDKTTSRKVIIKKI
jgi:hypothetical protein